MKAEIISIGSELTSGQNLDTNSQWLSKRLAEIGIAVRWHTTLADDLVENVEAIRIATGRASLVLLSGGLGPTQDDLTREALAQAAGVELVFDPRSWAQIQEMFTKRQRVMPERNRVQAMFPKGAEPIPNARGTAPGMWFQIRNCLLAAMPGVPSEMYYMFDNEVLPRLLRLEGRAGVIIQRKVNCFGAGESALESHLLDITRRGNDPEVGITVSEAMISLRIVARGPDVESAQAKALPIERIIRERLGHLVVGVEDEELHHAVIRLLSERRRTLTVAEGITGGQVAERLTRVPGASRCFAGGIIAYANEIKIKELGVPAELIVEHGAVSEPVAGAMAAGCRMRWGSDVAVSTVGLAGPDGFTDSKPIGLAYVGLAWKDGSQVRRFNWSGTRAEIQSRTAKLALDLVRLWLLGHDA
jgi:nicotinamide-nucleotide amidase